MPNRPISRRGFLVLFAGLAVIVVIMAVVMIVIVIILLRFGDVGDSRFGGEEHRGGRLADPRFGFGANCQLAGGR